MKLQRYKVLTESRIKFFLSHCTNWSRTLTRKQINLILYRSTLKGLNNNSPVVYQN